ncbi:hypothetical protein FB451DRAFT_1224876 [Mycena latifolia]|nr:hypothetical protein FB451DRAFT_1224876 [Mycena latifolia]
MRPAGSRSKRHVGHVVWPGRANHGPRHAAWKTCAQGSAMMASGAGAGGSLLSGAASGPGVESFEGAESDSGAGTCCAVAANSAPSPSRRRSQQMAQPLSPPTAPTSSLGSVVEDAETRSRRRMRPSGTVASPAMMRAAFAGESFGGGGMAPKTKSGLMLSGRPRVSMVKSWARGAWALSGFGWTCGGCGGGGGGGGGILVLVVGWALTRWDGWRRSRSWSWSSSLRGRRLPAVGSRGGMSLSSSSTSVQALSPSSSATCWCTCRRSCSSSLLSLDESLELDTDCRSGIESSDSWAGS